MNNGISALTITTAKSFMFADTAHTAGVTTLSYHN